MENPDRITYFAATDSRGKRVPFGIKQRDRNRHMYIIGKTGMGKSTLLENLAIQDIRNGEGLAFIDPHGGTAEKLLDYIPEERMKDVVYFAPFDLDYPIAFNVMEDVGYDKRHLVVSGLMATFKKIWVDAWSARMEYILTNTLLALLEYPDATLLGVNRMYTDKDYRTKVVDNVKDPVVKDFWVKEFANYGDRYTQEATPAIQNKIGQFTGNPLIRNIIGQPKSTFDIRTMMDQKKILIMNLSKGLVGETNMRLLGSMLTTRIFLAAMSRAEHSGQELARLPHFYFYVDEFQNFANETFAEILSEARKYNLNLTIAHQYIEQMEEEVAAAVFGNVGTTIAFRVGPFDADKLEVVFAPEFTPEDLVNLGFAQIYLSLMIDGVGSRPFSAVTIPSIEPPERSFKKEVVASSRAQFAAPRAGVEAAVTEELMQSLAAEPPIDARMRKPPKALQERAGVRINPYGPSGVRVVRQVAPRPQQGSSALTQAPREPQQQAPRAPAERPPVAQSQPQAIAGARDSRPTPPASSAPRFQQPARPPQKSSEELKNILRTMTTKHSETKTKEVTAKQQSLKSTLADVLAKNTKTEPAKAPVPRAKLAPTSPILIANTTPVAQPANPQDKKTFEVPEEKLRSILKGE